ncbi:MAG: YeeE/YedE family protein [Sphingomicrobium sp.]
MTLARRLVPPLVSGVLFGAGLTLSDMTDPARVRGFLDLFGNWDPTLAFVMGGAVLVMTAAWCIRARMAKPLFGEKFSLPDRGDVDSQLLAGSALFGIGWGVAGLCPGPAIASIALSPGAVLPFVAAMLAGMAIHRVWPKRHHLLNTRSVS